MKKVIGAIIIGGHFQGLGVIRNLAEKGVPIALADHEHNLSRFSRYVKYYFKIPSLSEPDKLLDELIRIAKIGNVRGWVIFPTDDETVFFLSKHREILLKYYKLITPGWEITKYSYNKKYSYQAVEKLGIPVPKTYYPENIDDVSGLEIKYPAIVKPAVMRTFFKQTGKKVFRATNHNELIQGYQRAKQFIPANEILIQDEIPNVTQNLYSFCPWFKNGKTLAKIVATRPRQHPMDFGNASTLAHTVDYPQLIEMGTKILKAFNYYGLGEVEFLMDTRDGQLKFLEINPRIWGWHTLAGHAGVNIPYLVYLDQIGIEKEIPDYRKHVKWIRLLTDTATVLSEIRKGRMSFKDYFRSLRGDKTFAVWSLKDPMPFLGELLLLPYLYKKRGF